MSKFRFTAQDMAGFEKRCAETPGWDRWERRTDADGRDVLEVTVCGPRPAVIQVTRTDTGGYAARGYDGWSLVLCDEMDQLMDLLTKPSRRRADSAPPVTAALPQRRSAA